MLCSLHGLKSLMLLEWVATINTIINKKTVRKCKKRKLYHDWLFFQSLSFYIHATGQDKFLKNSSRRHALEQFYYAWWLPSIPGTFTLSSSYLNYNATSQQLCIIQLKSLTIQRQNDARLIVFTQNRVSTNLRVHMMMMHNIDKPRNINFSPASVKN